jgi:AAA+ ATPase superfamily predicted ATPase
MDKNTPFIYGNTVSEEAFTNRSVEIKKLYGNLTNGINTMLISPRRWGKSSLVEKVLKEIGTHENHHKIVTIDLFTISGEEEFLEVYAREILKASSSKWQDWISAAKEFFKQLIPQITIGTDPVNDFNIGFNWEELSKHSEEILNLPEEIAKRKKIRFIIALDEFQNLATLRGYGQFEKKLRAIWQRQKMVCYCLYGSKRHMMTDIFSNPSKPFFRFGDIMLLKKISLADWQKFIQERFNSTGKKISAELALLIPDLMGCHSWYVQQFAHYT